MHLNLNPLAILSNIKALPDGHLHSKVSFLKSIINDEQNPQIKQTKQKMYKLSYTIKNIGIHGQEIGITSKRFPLKQKEQYIPSQITSQKQKQIFRFKHLPSNTFYSQPLIPIKKPKSKEYQPKNHLENLFLISTSNLNQNQFSQTFHHSPETKFAKKLQTKTKFGKIFSHAAKFNNFNKESHLKNKELIEKITSDSYKNTEYQLSKLKKFRNTKSFSKLLYDFERQNQNLQIRPLQHQQNSMFKKFKKLKEIANTKAVQKNDKLLKTHNLYRTSSTFTGRYQTNLSQNKKKYSRRTLQNIDS